MAEGSFKKLDEQLLCAMCLDTYSDPKVLQCFHVYCSDCVVKLVSQNRKGRLYIPCPTCRKCTPLPTKGASGLQSAFHINELLEIRDGLKKANSTVSSLEVNTSKSMCSEHDDNELQLYCETCDELICLKCVTISAKHQSHKFNTPDVLVDRYKEEITLSLEAMEKKSKILETGFEQLEERCEEISIQQACIEASIHDTVKQFHEFLDIRKTELISKLHQVTQGKLKDLMHQKEEMEVLQVQLNACREFVTEKLTEGYQEEILKSKSSLIKQINELSSLFDPNSLKPSIEANVKFLVSSDVTTGCQSYGEVCEVNLPDPSKCNVIGNGLEAANVGEKSTAILQTIDSQGELCEVSIESLQCELVSELTSSVVRGNVKRKLPSQYEISYFPTNKGKHKLYVKIEGKDIPGSPFFVVVTTPVKELSSPILKITELAKPRGVTINLQGDVVVTEKGRHCASIFSPSGERLQKFGDFKHPHGLAVDDEGNILIADLNGHQIQRFSPNGQFLAAVGTKGTKRLQFHLPHDIMFNTSNNKLYVADTKNDRIQVLNSDLTFFHVFGKTGSGDGCFDHPRSVACDSTGNVYVADCFNNRIQVFTANGQFVRKFGKGGHREGELDRPNSIAIDSSDKVYICEFFNHRISVFTSEGQFLTAFGKKGTKPGEFNFPTGLAVDSNGVVYVCDSDNNQIQAF